MWEGLIEPPNLVLEHLRFIRADMSQIKADVSEVRADVAALKTDVAEFKKDMTDVKKELRGLKLNTIAEVYKANLTVASFADHEKRIQELERKSL